jgi:alpha-glucuronidase
MMLLAAALASGRESGHELWLRYPPIEDQALGNAYRRSAASIVVSTATPTGRVIAGELRRGLSCLLAVDVPTSATPAAGAIVAGTPETSPTIKALGWSPALDRAGDEGYVIRTARIAGNPVTVIASRTEVGALRGVFHYVRLLQTRQPVAALDILERPRMPLRLLNHWDNLDGSIERGYAGPSLWKWAELPGRVDPRVEEYARANASIGINGVVLNNVNANPESLSPAYLVKAAAVADVLRPYGIRVYLSANFAAPAGGA